MFFFLSLLAMLAYSFQGTFLVKYARNTEGLSLAVYRNLSLAVSMLPVFFFVDFNDLKALFEVWHLILIASLSGAVSLWAVFLAYHSLPVGIISAFSKIRVIFILFWAYLFLNEVVSGWNLVNIGVILGAVFFLALQKHHMPHLSGNVKNGILLALANGFFISLGFFFMSYAARLAHPLMVGYFWEVFIGVFALIFTFFRYLFVGRGLQRISWKRFFGIAKVSSLTLLGTGSFALAVTYGPIGIVSAIGATATIVTTLISHFLYHEKLSRKQWVGIFVVVFGVIGLKVLY